VDTFAATGRLQGNLDSRSGFDMERGGRARSRSQLTRGDSRYSRASSQGGDGASRTSRSSSRRSRGQDSDFDEYDEIPEPEPLEDDELEQMVQLSRSMCAAQTRG